jgi:hypothetical protein
MVAFPMTFAPMPSLVLNDMIPIGGIIQWSGSILSIPSNFQLCDGTNGTPDLRDKFIVGAGSTYAVDDAGGAVDHNHGPVSLESFPPTPVVQAWTGSVTTTEDHLPPYLALASIQRMT